MLGGTTPKGQCIGKGIWHILQGAIDRHEPQAEGKGPWRLFGGTGTADALEQDLHGAHAQLLAALGECTGSRQAHARIRPDVAQALGDFREDVGNG